MTPAQYGIADRDVGDVAGRRFLVYTVARDNDADAILRGLWASPATIRRGSSLELTHSPVHRVRQTMDLR